MASKIMPKLGVTNSEYEIVGGIASLNYWSEEIKETHKLHDGSSKFYHKGYKFRARLTFANMTQTDYDGLLTEYNRHTELNFIPYPGKYPGTNFEVRWINEWNFVFAFVFRDDRYKGSIELEGTEILSSIPTWI